MQAELTDLNVGATVIVPAAANSPANGLTRATVTLQLARNNGAPLAGQSVHFISAHCTVLQPVVPTDAAGRAHAEVMCATPSVETISASVSFNGAAVAVPPSTQINFFSPGDGHLGVAAGTQLAAQVVARDAQGEGIDTDYTGTVTFSSTDPLASLPPEVTLTAANRGFYHWNQGLMWRTVGVQTLSATDKATGRVVYTETYTVVPSPAQGIRLVASEAPQAGRDVGLTVAVVDSLGNVIPTYTGTVQLFSSDPLASLPASLVFTPADAGRKILAAGLVLRTAGQQSISAQDNGTPPLTGSAALVVASGSVKQLVFAGLPMRVASGTALSASVRAADAYGNPVPSYLGTARLASSDARLQLPATVTFGAAARGEVSLAGLAFVSAGLTALTASPVGDANLMAAQATVVVDSGPAQQLLVLPQASALAGQPISLLVQVVDAASNPVSDYRGTVSFASDDPEAVLPGSYTFIANDSGSHAFSEGLAFARAGARTVVAQDANGLAGQGACLVDPAGLSQMIVTAPLQSVAGQAFALQVAGADAYGNVVSSYTGSVALSSLDGQANLPSSVTIGPGDQGQVSVSGVTLRTAGAQAVTAVDGSGLSLQSGSATVTVSAAAITKITIKNVPATASIAMVITPTVAGTDMFGNPAAGYRGSMSFTSSDPCATLPGAYAYGAGDAGTHDFTGDLMFNTLGTQTFTATDDQGHTASQSVSVTHGCGSFGWSVVPGAGFVNNIQMAMDPNGNPWFVTVDNRGYWLPGGWWDNWRVFAVHWTGKFMDQSSNPQGIGRGPISTSDYCAYNPSLTLDGNGMPFISWADFCNGGIYLARLQDGVWQGVGGSQANPIAAGAGDHQVVVSKQGTPWLAWADGGTAQISLRYYDGAQWRGPGGSFLVPGSAQYTSKDMAIDSQGRLYVAFTSNHNGSKTLQAYVVMWDGNGWQGLAGSDTGPGVSNTVGGANTVRIAIDSLDRPVVSWSDSRGGNQQVYVTRYAAGSWQGFAGSDANAGASNLPSQVNVNASLAIDAHDLPVIAWYVYNSGYNTQYQVGRFDGSAWSLASNDVNLVTSGGWMRSSLAVDKRDKPLLAYWRWSASWACSLY